MVSISKSLKLPDIYSYTSLHVTAPSPPVSFARQNLFSAFLAEILTALGSMTSELFKSWGKSHLLTTR